MLNKKDNKCIFEQYYGLIKEQSDDLLSQVKKSPLDPKVKQQLIAILNDPDVAPKWKSGDADTVNLANNEFGKELSKLKYDYIDQETANQPDVKFGKELSDEQKRQNLAFPENEESNSLGKYNYQTGCHENESTSECQIRKDKYKTALASFSR